MDFQTVAKRLRAPVAGEQLDNVTFGMVRGQNRFVGDRRASLTWGGAEGLPSIFGVALWLGVIMSNKVYRFAGRGLARGLAWVAAVCLLTMWSATAMATITQGDFSVFGQLTSAWSGRWGEGSKFGATPTTFSPATGTGATVGFPADATPGTKGVRTGGSFDFNHWDLVQARQFADIRPDYHIVKNYNLLGRFDTLLLKDADVFAVYFPWYDAEPDLKHKGIAQLDRDWTNYSDRARVQQFVRNDLREYYGQLNFTDNFSARIGKQQVIWSEADALSGTDVTNPTDLRYHWTHFESDEDERVNLRMVKLNYIFPDFLNTANNELDFFIIPGDWEGGSMLTNNTDARSPYVAQAAVEGNGPGYNQYGNQYLSQTLADGDPTPLRFVPASAALNVNSFLDEKTIIQQDSLSNSLQNSEFGARYSTLLPIGNGLQTSFIWLYEARSTKLGFCNTCKAPPGYFSMAPTTPPGTFISVSNKTVAEVEGIPVTPLLYGPPKQKLLPMLGNLKIFLDSEVVRQNYLDITGTYYDKDLTDIVYRYDAVYTPKEATNTSQPGPYTTNNSGARWTEFSRWIVAGDRPTYIPWLSKQHTFITFQNTLTWYPDRPSNAVFGTPVSTSKQRELSELTVLAFTNWLINGQLTATNDWVWDWDNQVGYVESANVYRYSRNILLSLNAIWYLGKSGRYTDPFLFSRDQRINETEFRFSYEI